MKVFVEIEGLNEVVSAFGRMGENGKKVLHAAVNKGAAALAPKIKQAIPSGASDDKRLKDTVKVAKAKPKKTTYQSAEIRIGNKGSDYAFQLETGHRTQAGKAVKPVPYARKTTDDNTAEIADIVASEILNGIEV